MLKFMKYFCCRSLRTIWDVFCFNLISSSGVMRSFLMKAISSLHTQSGFSSRNVLTKLTMWTTWRTKFTYTYVHTMKISLKIKTCDIINKYMGRFIVGLLWGGLGGKHSMSVKVNNCITPLKPNLLGYLSSLSLNISCTHTHTQAYTAPPPPPPQPHMCTHTHTHMQHNAHTHHTHIHS